VIAWQNPGAFIGLVALAGPIVIHLLQRQRAARLSFPTDRFIRPAVTGAVRLRLPSDVLLLALRLAILAAAVCALAQPVLVTAGRLQAWNERTARAVVVDTSESMSMLVADVAAAVETETRSAATAIRLESRDLADGVRRAAMRLARAAPARREIVVISDFQQGALSQQAIAAVPSLIGVRFVRVGQSVARREARGASLLGNGGYAWQPEVTVEPERTSVIFAKTAGQSDGLRIASSDDADAAGLVRAVASSGAPGPLREQPIVVTFGGPKTDAVARLSSRWMLETALRLRHDRELSRLSGSGPVIRTAASGDALAVNVAAGPESYTAATALRATLTARQGDIARTFSEHEVRTTDESELKAWARQAPPVDADVWRYAEESDVRWCWAIVLLLLAVETGVRARVKS
jgi:hypothetical protein